MQLTHLYRFTPPAPDRESNLTGTDSCRQTTEGGSCMSRAPGQWVQPPNHPSETRATLNSFPSSAVQTRDNEQRNLQRTEQTLLLFALLNRTKPCGQ